MLVCAFSVSFGAVMFGLTSKNQTEGGPRTGGRILIAVADPDATGFHDTGTSVSSRAGIPDEGAIACGMSLSGTDARTVWFCAVRMADSNALPGAATRPFCVALLCAPT
jgi:hypothetical protein